jgi:hypothetical protein
LVLQGHRARQTLWRLTQQLVLAGTQLAAPAQGIQAEAQVEHGALEVTRVPFVLVPVGCVCINKLPSEVLGPLPGLSDRALLRRQRLDARFLVRLEHDVGCFGRVRAPSSLRPDHVGSRAAPEGLSLRKRCEFRRGQLPALTDVQADEHHEVAREQSDRYVRAVKEEPGGVAQPQRGGPVSDGGLVSDGGVGLEVGGLRGDSAAALDGRKAIVPILGQLETRVVGFAFSGAATVLRLLLGLFDGSFLRAFAGLPPGCRVLASAQPGRPSVRQRQLACERLLGVGCGAGRRRRVVGAHCGAGRGRLLVALARLRGRHELVRTCGCARD